MTYKEFVTKAIDALQEIYSINESKAIAVRVLTHYLGISDYEYLVSPNVIIPKPEVKKLQGALDELLACRPVQYVLGYEEFAGHKFCVCESVLIPRPETEELVRLIESDWVEDKMSELKILDVCTGSGCIAHSLAAHFRKARVMACDLSDEALEVAGKQKICENEPLFFKWDALDGPPDEKDIATSSEAIPELEELDILVSNPPYVCEKERDFMSPNVLDYEPSMALFVPDGDPLRFYKALAEWASALLRVGGKGYFEINEAYHREVVALFESYGFSDVTMVEDIHTKPRIVHFTKWF